MARVRNEVSRTYVGENRASLEVFGGGRPPLFFNEGGNRARALPSIQARKRSIEVITYDLL